jgi:hypothetical protein
MWEEDEAEQRRQQRRANGGSGGRRDDEDGEGDEGAPPDPAEFLERLSRAMRGGGPGGLSAFQSGRLDPFGTSSSDAWFRRVEQQTSSPFGGRPGGGFGRGLGGDRLRGNPEWEPFRPGDGEDGSADGWRRPGQRPEWERRPGWGRPDDDDEEGGGGGGGSRPLKGDDFRRGGGGGGGFRGW